MKENLVTIKAAIVACCTALGAFLGWKGVMLLAWVLEDVPARWREAVRAELADNDVMQLS